jgi:hypothetical protein
MRHQLTTAFLIFLTAATAPQAASAARPRTATAAADDLDFFADALPPTQQLVEIAIGGCTTGYRTKLSTNKGDIALEQRIPGIGERILAAAAAYCQAQLPAFLVEQHRFMRGYWGGIFTPAERTRLAPLLHALLEDIADVHIVYKPGDMPLAATRSSVAGKTAPRYEAAAARLQQTPGGRELVDRLWAANDKTGDLFETPDSPLAHLIHGAQDAGHAAANAYAREKGFGDVYDPPEASR